MSPIEATFAGSDTCAGAGLTAAVMPADTRDESWRGLYDKARREAEETPAKWKTL